MTPYISLLLLALVTFCAGQSQMDQSQYLKTSDPKPQKSDFSSTQCCHRGHEVAMFTAQTREACPVHNITLGENWNEGDLCEKEGLFCCCERKSTNRCGAFDPNFVKDANVFRKCDNDNIIYIYKCNSGYILQGDPVVSCDGKIRVWDPSPRCMAASKELMRKAGVDYQMAHPQERCIDIPDTYIKRTLRVEGNDVIEALAEAQQGCCESVLFSTLLNQTYGNCSMKKAYSMFPNARAYCRAGQVIFVQQCPVGYNTEKDGAISTCNKAGEWVSIQQRVTELQCNRPTPDLMTTKYFQTLCRAVDAKFANKSYVKEKDTARIELECKPGRKIHVLSISAGPVGMTTGYVNEIWTNWTQKWSSYKSREGFTELDSSTTSYEPYEDCRRRLNIPIDEARDQKDLPAPLQNENYIYTMGSQRTVRRLAAKCHGRSRCIIRTSADDMDDKGEEPYFLEQITHKCHSPGWTINMCEPEIHVMEQRDVAWLQTAGYPDNSVNMGNNCSCKILKSSDSAVSIKAMHREYKNPARNAMEEHFTNFNPETWQAGLRSEPIWASTEGTIPMRKDFAARYSTSPTTLDESGKLMTIIAQDFYKLWVEVHREDTIKDERVIIACGGASLEGWLKLEGCTSEECLKTQYISHRKAA